MSDVRESGKAWPLTEAELAERSRDAHYSGLEKELEAAYREQERLIDDANYLRRHLDDSHAARRRAEAALDQYKRHEPLIVGLQNRILELQSENRELKEELERVKAELGKERVDHNRVLVHYENMKQERDALRAENERLLLEIAR